MASLFTDHCSSKATFNENLALWDTSSVTNMAFMFAGATNFNVDLSIWNVSRVESFEYMFSNATALVQVLCWDVAESQSTNFMFSLISNQSSLNASAAKCACLAGEYYKEQVLSA